jgi:hypothetical protein
MMRSHADAQIAAPTPTDLQARRKLIYSCDAEHRVSSKLGLETITREIIRTSDPV